MSSRRRAGSLAAAKAYHPSCINLPTKGLDLDPLNEIYVKSEPINSEAQSDYRQASQIFQELLQTEEQYVQDIRTLCEVFREPIVADNILNQKEVNSIFSNIHMILPVNESFLDRLIKIRESALELLANQNEPEIRSPVKNSKVTRAVTYSVRNSVGNLQQKLNVIMINGVANLFTEYLTNKFKQYLVYCSGMGEVYKRVNMYAEENRQFDLFLQKKLQEPACRMMDLHSFLVMPMQRIMRYPLLLKELRKCTPSVSIEHKLLDNAICKCEETISMINQRARIVQDLEKLVKLTSQLYIPSTSDKKEYKEAVATNRGGVPIKGFDLVLKGRTLLIEGKLIISPNPERFGDYGMLFNDVLILSQTSNEHPPALYSLRRIIDRKSIIIASDPADDNADELRIAEVGYQLLHIKFCSKLKRKKWLGHLMNPVVTTPRTSSRKDSGKSSFRSTLSVGEPRRVQSYSKMSLDNLDKNDIKEEDYDDTIFSPRKARKKGSLLEERNNSEIISSPRESESQLKRRGSLKGSVIKKKNKSNIEKATKQKEKSSIFSFWKSKITSDKPVTSPPSKIKQQGDRIEELEKQLKTKSDECDLLESKVAELNSLLKSQEDTIKNLQKQLEQQKKEEVKIDSPQNE